MHQPVALRFARLVLCEDFSTQQIGECGPYIGPGMLPVIQERMAISAVEPRTATEVAAQAFEGSPTLDCPNRVTIDLDHPTPDIRHEVDDVAVQRFIDSLTTRPVTRASERSGRSRRLRTGRVRARQARGVAVRRSAAEPGSDPD